MESLLKFGLIAIPIGIALIVILGLVNLSEFMVIITSTALFSFSGLLVYYLKSKNQITSQINNSSLLSEHRAKYYQDLKELINLIEKNTSNTHTQTYFDSLTTLSFKEKRLILQHFYTDEKDFHSHHKLYSNYRKYVGLVNAIYDDKQTLFNKIEELAQFLIKTNKKFSKSKAMFDIKKLETALHLSPDTIGFYLNFFNDTNFYQKIPYNLVVGMDRENKIIFFTINDVRIGSINSSDDFYKISPKLQEFSRIISKSATDIHVAYKTVDNWLSVMYSNSLITAIEPLKRGESIIGVCEGCIEYFNTVGKKRYQKTLTKFNSDLDNSIESTWRNKKPLKKSFLQIFAKNHSDSFRDGL